jgi:hypothetical protein
MSSGFGRRPNPPPLLRYASCAAGLTPASEVEFKLISSKCLVVCAAERSKGGGFGLAEAGGHERRSACHQAFASPTRMRAEEQRLIAKVVKRQRQIGHLFANQRHSSLQVIAFSTADTHCIALNSGLYFDLAVFNQALDFF